MLKIALVCSSVLFVSSHSNSRIELTESLQFAFLLIFFWQVSSKIIISKNIFWTTFFLLFQFELFFNPLTSMDSRSFSFQWPLLPSFLDILSFFLLLFFQTITMSEQSEQLINQYIDEINLLPLPTSFESRRRTLDLCYAIRLEYTRTAASIARHKKALQSIVVLINILRKHPPSQIEE